MFINATFLGYIAATCTTCSFIPQVVHTLKTKDTSAISLGMYSLFVLGVLLWLIYGLSINNLPIIIANIITLALSTLILILKFKDTLTSKRNLTNRKK